MAIRLAQDWRARRLNNSASPLHTHRSGTPFLNGYFQKKLEVSFLCKDGAEQLCSRQLLGLSDFLYIKANEMGGVKEKIQFDYTNYSFAAVKFFLDCMHQIEPEPTDVSIVLEALDLAHWEGKTDFDSFERYLSKRFMAAIMESSFPIGTELLIAAFLSKVDNLDEDYQKKIAQKLGRDFYAHVYCDFDMDSTLNQRLIEMCVFKGIVPNNTRKSVVFTLTNFGEDLVRIYELPSSFE